MNPHDDSDWDSDEGSEHEDQTSLTAVLLGVPDGAIDEESDLNDPMVSKIGGPPVSPSSCHIPFIYLHS
jgi:pre-rRNA-processing protein TSR4